MKNIAVIDKWRLDAAGRSVECTVPCSLFSAFCENGFLPDPYKDFNEKKYLALAENDCVFSAKFDFSPEKNKQYVLRLEKVDTYSSVYVNGHLVGETDNAFMPFSFDIPPKALKSGENEIRVCISSAVALARKNYNRYPVLSCMDHKDIGVFGRASLRKPQYMFGWDWGACLPDAGIYGEVAIGEKCTEFSELIITQKHEKDRVTVKVKSSPDCLIELFSPNGELVGKEETYCGKCEIVVCSPQLWWPNNFGAQPLYKIVASKADGVIEEKKIGLRTIEVSQQRDEYGSEFCFVVNGKKIFAMGGNYIPQDHIIPRISKERTYKLIRQCKDANFNMIRVWGGGDYASEDFFDACDEMGIIVWQDCMFACQNVYLSDKFLKNIVAEIESNIKRISHRASLGLICGNNEIEAMICDRIKNTYPYVVHRPFLDANDYLTLFEHVIPDIAERYAPDTFYWSCSPSSGGGFYFPSDENFGDTHEWSIWYDDNVKELIKRSFPRFCSEFGVTSYPAKSTLEKFSDKKITSLDDDVVKSHFKKLVYTPEFQSANNQNMDLSLEKADGIEAQIQRSQKFQAETIGAYVEHLRINRGRCMGALYWQINDSWPCVSWSMIDYCGDEKQSYAEIKRVFSPVLAAMEENGGVVKLYVCNETFEKFNGKYSIETEEKKIEGEVVAPALSVVETSSVIGTNIKFVLKDNNGKIISEKQIIKKKQ